MNIKAELKKKFAKLIYLDISKYDAVLYLRLEFFHIFYTVISNLDNTLFANVKKLTIPLSILEPEYTVQSILLPVILSFEMLSSLRFISLFVSCHYSVYCISCTYF